MNPSDKPQAAPQLSAADGAAGAPMTTAAKAVEAVKAATAAIAPKPALVRADDLHIAPGVLALPLAAPWRRLTAIALDLLLVGALSSMANGWMLMVLLAAGVLQAWAHWRGRLMSRLLVGLLGCLFVAALWSALQGRGDHKADPYRDLERRVDQVANATADAGRGAAAVSLGELSKRIEALENELAGMRKTGAAKLQLEVDRWLDDAGIRFGWALLYFTFLPTWLPGQTIGKRIMGIRAVSLTGLPLDLLTCFRRYGGYAAGMATGGLGFAQILWDPNRQALQDKTAHTVVVSAGAVADPKAGSIVSD